MIVLTPPHGLLIFNCPEVVHYSGFGEVRSHHAEESTYNRGGGAFEGYGTCVARLETTSKDALHLSSKQGPDFNDCTCKKASVNVFFVSTALQHELRVSHVFARRFPC